MAPLCNGPNTECARTCLIRLVDASPSPAQWPAAGQTLVCLSGGGRAGAAANRWGGADKTGAGKKAWGTGCGAHCT